MGGPEKEPEAATQTLLVVKLHGAIVAGPLSVKFTLPVFPLPRMGRILRPMSILDGGQGDLKLPALEMESQKSEQAERGIQVPSPQLPVGFTSTISCDPAVKESASRKLPPVETL